MQLTPFVAIRHLRARLRSTLLTAAGVAMGVTVMIVMASLLIGLQVQFVDNLVESTPHITVEGAASETGTRNIAVPNDENAIVGLTRRPPPEATDSIRNYRQRVEGIERLPGVLAAAPTLSGRVLLRYGTRSQPVQLNGVVPDQYARTLQWQDKLRRERADLAQTPGGVVIGSELARNLGIPPGARVTLTGGPERETRMRVIAFYESGIRLIDESVTFVNLNTAQTLLNRPDEVSHIAVRIEDINRAPEIAERIQAVTGLEAESWQAANANFFAIFRLQQTITSFLISFIVLIAGFGITNGLITLILDKQRDIGILKALGATRARVVGIFLVEGVLMGVLGAVLGMGLGALGVDYLDQLPLRGEGQLSTESTFTMLRTPPVYLIPAAIAVVVSLLASLLPVRRAAGYDPVEIIRGAK